MSARALQCACPSAALRCESHRNEYLEDIVTTGANEVATDPVVQKAGPALTLMDFRAACAALFGFALVHNMH